MSRYKPYPEYKDSGIKAIGTVPSHWVIAPLRSAMHRKKSVVGSAWQDFKLLSLTKSGVIERDVTDNFGKFPESFETYQAVSPNDLVMCLFDIDETPRTVGLSETHGMITGAYTVFGIGNSAQRDYLYQLFLHLDNVKGLKPYYSGLRKTIRPPKLLGMRIPIPPAAESEAISKHITTSQLRFDTLIEKKQRFIELLEEKRQAVITQAVTKGLDPNVPMKDSGVEWIGAVPAHWGVVPLRRLCTLQTGATPPTSEEDNYTNDGIPWARPEDIKEDSLTVEPSRMLTSKGASYTRTIAVNSLLISCIGTIGKVGFVDYPVTTNQQITAATFHFGPAFYLYFLLAARSEIESLSVGNVISILNTERLGELMVVTPPPDEAELIADSLTSEFEAIGGLIDKTRESIELLKERRAALITAAVTGKIDVREEAA